MRIVISILVCLCLFSGLGVAESGVTIFLDDVPVKTSISPVNIEGRYYIGVRDLLETMGFEVVWNGKAKTVTASSGIEKYVFGIDEKKVLKGTQPLEISTPPRMIEGRTMLPVRGVSELFGYSVTWIEAKQTIDIVRPENKYVVEHIRAYREKAKTLGLIKEEIDATVVLTDYLDAVNQLDEYRIAAWDQSFKNDPQGLKAYMKGIKQIWSSQLRYIDVDSAEGDGVEGSFVWSYKTRVLDGSTSMGFVKLYRYKWRDKTLEVSISPVDSFAGNVERLKESKKRFGSDNLSDLMGYGTEDRSDIGVIPMETGKASLRTFVSQDGRISMDYSSDWQVQEYERFISFTSPLQGFKDSYRESVLISTIENEMNLSLQAYVEEQIDKLGINREGFKLVESKATTISGAQGWKLQFTYESGGNQIFTEAVIVPNQKQFIVINYNGLSESLIEFDEIKKKMMNSFKLN